MSGYLDIVNIQVPSSVADETNEILRAVGERGTEAFALWVGNREGLVFKVTETVIPAQTGHITDDGVCVSVGPEELHRLNVWLYTKKLNIIAQLHTHPGSAYHSETDDRFAIATTAGCLSLVIPDFARHPFSLSACAVYKLTENGIWSFLPVAQVQKLFSLTD